MKETSAVYVFSENSQMSVRFGSSESDRIDGVTSSMRDQMPDESLIQPESLILAQNERWRQA